MDCCCVADIVTSIPKPPFAVGRLQEESNGMAGPDGVR